MIDRAMSISATPEVKRGLSKIIERINERRDSSSHAGSIQRYVCIASRCRLIYI